MAKTFKKLMAMLLAACLILALFPAEALAFPGGDYYDGSKIVKVPEAKPAPVQNTASDATPDGYYWHEKDGKVIIDGYSGRGGAITIPDTIDGKTVTGIDNEVFHYNSDITSVKIGRNLKTIGKFVFSSCYNLTGFKVDSANTAFSTDSYGVLFNKAKTKLIQFPVDRSLSKYTVPSGVTDILEGAFERAFKLTQITLPSSLKNILEAAFRYCEVLPKINIPRNVAKIEIRAFAGCFKMTQITVDSANAKFSALSGVLYDKAKRTLLQYPSNRSATSFSVPGSVTKIADSALYNAFWLQTISLPRSVSFIGDGAFVYCHDLKAMKVDSANKYFTSVSGVLYNKAKTQILLYPPSRSGSAYALPSSVKSIGLLAFNSSRYLTSVTLPKSLTAIGEAAFLNCTKLSAITIPASVKAMGNYTFLQSGIKKVSLGTGLKDLPQGAFCNCANLTSVVIPKNIVGLGSSCFSGCTKLSSATIPYQTIYIGFSVFPFSSRMVITGPANSVIQAYAEENDIRFKTSGTTPSYTVKAASSNSAYGTVYGANTYYYGFYCVLEAVPADGHRFVKWTENGKLVSTDEWFEFQVTKSRSFTAVFE